MRSLLALLALLAACGPLPAPRPCSGPLDCPGTTCALGRCTDEAVEPQLFPGDPPPFVPDGPSTTRGHRVTAGLVALLFPGGEASGWGPALDASLLDDEVDLSPRLDGCPGFTLEAFTPDAAASAAPLLRLAGATLQASPGQRHHSLAVDGPPPSDLLEIEGELSLAAVYCRALSPGELARNRELGPERPARVVDGLLLRYRFAEDGPLARDEGPGLALHLTPTGEWSRVPGGVRLEAARFGGGFAAPLHDRLDDALSVELWLDPALEPEGCLLSDVGDPGQVNLELHQRGNLLEVRVGDDLLTAPVPPGLVHLVVTHDGARLAVYVNGALVVDSDAAPLALRPGRFGLGDALAGGDPWRGALYDLAVYDRALSSVEVLRSFAHGPEATDAPRSL